MYHLKVIKKNIRTLKDFSTTISVFNTVDNPKDIQANISPIRNVITVCSELSRLFKIILWLVHHRLYVLQDLLTISLGGYSKYSKGVVFVNCFCKWSVNLNRAKKTINSVSGALQKSFTRGRKIWNDKGHFRLNDLSDLLNWFRQQIETKLYKQLNQFCFRYSW